MAIRTTVDSCGTSTDGCKALFPMIWGTNLGYGKAILDRGLVVRPENVLKPAYKRLQDELIMMLEKYSGESIFDYHVQPVSPNQLEVPPGPES